MQNLNKTNKIKVIALIVFFIIMIVATVFAVPLVKLLLTPDGRVKIKKFVESFGFFGVFIFVGFQIIQIIIAIIPGEPFEIIGGVLYGAFGGFILCLLGVLIGTIIVFYLVKWLGQPLVSLIIKRDKLSKLKILNDNKKLELLVFILFLIPGTPKDILTYFVPLTKIRPIKYFTYSTIARIPSIISSTLVGANIGKGNWRLSVIILLSTVAIGLVGILYNDKLLKSIKSHKNTHNSD